MKPHKTDKTKQNINSLSPKLGSAFTQAREVVAELTLPLFRERTLYPCEGGSGA